MKEEKNKVGRPKHADTNLKKNSIIMIEIAVIGLISLVIGGIFSLTNVNIRNLKGQVSKEDYKFELVDVYGDRKWNKYELNYYCDLRAVVSNVGKKVEFITRNGSSSDWSFNNVHSSEKIGSENSKYVRFDNGKTHTVELTSYTHLFPYREDGVYTAVYTFYADKKCNVSDIKLRSESYSPIASYKPGWNKRAHYSSEDTDYCYMNKNGKPYLSEGKHKVKYKGKKKTYYFESDGCIHTGLYYCYKCRYQTLKSGLLMSKFKTLNGETYYFKKNGIIAREEFIKVNNKWYYFDEDAKMLKNTITTINGQKYQFNKNGVCIYGAKCGITTTTKKTTKKKTTSPKRNVPQTQNK